ncbi:MAG: glycosyltransferase [Coprococcus sp.]|jgi:glycosyltransferase involved in cell wall biosynthesis
MGKNSERVDRKIKVLFLLEAFDKGGIEQVTLDIVNNLNPNKYDITIQTFWYGGHCQSLVNKNIKVLPLFLKKYIPGVIRLIEYMSPKMLYKLFIRGNYDVEIAASDGGAAKVISGSTNKKSKKICWVHMDVINRGSQLDEFQKVETAKKIYDKFDLIVPVSESCKEKFIEKFGNDYTYCVKKNPLPDEKIRLKSLENPAISFNKEKFNFVCIGRLEEQKGFDRLIEACRKVCENTKKQFHVYIIGDGTLRGDLQKQIKQCDVKEQISLIGFQENPYAILKQADAFLLTSRDEAFPLVVGESLIVGIPVIATECCGVAEWLENGKYGMIVENSLEGIVRGMKTCLENQEIVNVYRNRISENESVLSFDKLLRDFEEILNV